MAKKKKEETLTPLSLKIISAIKKVPRGRVATYGQIAKLAGNPGAARRVVWILHACSKSHKLPWQRIISSQGKISFPWGTGSYTKQKNLLRAEKIEVDEYGSIELKKFQWKR